MYDIRDVSAVITMVQELRDKVDAERFLHFVKDDQIELVTDILVDLYMIRRIMKPRAWYDPEPYWDNDREEIWVWIEDNN